VIEAVVTDGYVPGENPRIGAIDPLEANVMVGVDAVVGNPVPLQKPEGGRE
jgi:hypothetical protein